MTTATYPIAPAVPRVSAGARALGYAILADLLILPYFPLFVMPFSLGIVVAWAVCRFEVRVDRDVRIFFFIAACVLLSAMFSIGFRERELVVANFKRAGQLLTSFAYYFFFRSLARDPRFDLRPVLTVFLFIITVWVLFFIAAPIPSTQFAQAIYPTAAMGEVNLTFFRFAYMFADPNTAAYLIAIVAIFLMSYRQPSATRMVLSLLVLAVGTFATGSRGAVLAVFGAVVVLLWRRGIIGRYAIRFAIAAVLIGVFAVFAFRSYIASHPEKAATIQRVFDVASERITGGEKYSIEEVLYQGENSAGEDRIATWRVAVTAMKPFPLGRGYELTYGENNTLRPHSDVLRFLYSYGFLTLIAVWIFWFRDFWRFEFVWPALMAFGVNSIIDEQKLLSVFLVLLAIARVEERRGTWTFRGSRQARRARV